MTVEELLDRVDDMLDKAWSIGGKCLIDSDNLRDIVDDIRGSMPNEIRQARAIVADRGKIVDNAKVEADDIIIKAEDRARKLVANEEIVRQAQQKANEILSQSQLKSREMRKGAMDYSEDVLKRSEEILAQRLAEIRQARQALRNPSRPDDEMMNL